MRAAVLMVLMLGAFTAAASGSSLPSGPGPRPGPAILYEPTAVAPELTNTGIWKASPILISGTSAYRGGEFLYQDYLYDDHGAHELPDPTDPRVRRATCSPSPTGRTRIRPGPATPTTPPISSSSESSRLACATAFRVTLNTLENPSLIAFSIAIGGHPGQSFPFPDGANVAAPAQPVPHRPPVGLAARGRPRPRRNRHSGGRTGPDRPGRSPAPADRGRRPPPGLEPGAEHRAAGRWASGSGTPPTARYLLPQATADATHPGGAGTATNPPAFFNVAFRTAEPLPSVTAEPGAVTNAAWWRDQRAGHGARRGRHLAVLCQRELRQARRAGHRQLAASRSAVRWTASSPAHFEPAQGANFLERVRAAGRRGPVDLRARVSGQPPAVRDLRPAGRAARRRLRDDAAAALAVGQLQPVLRQPQPVAVRATARSRRS